ncbi:PREDICTED: uncharacterized protein LOC104801307 [Tarenaya hassleriana]|uniref:uncharacterized protein LOC104801307 n=1 Tax=Tarenaya hassleriana TaxID=28532 RepID=UPI00053C9399|nr:PREDICTED: uncharacterized protein LOC104801307 [Tarenaya hassleriana]XP_010522829.1 PREDICTED: uncharacterized protein LOC104801307 [Tarenaya hassleriana]
MDRVVSGQKDLEVDIESGVSDVSQESTANLSNGRTEPVWSECSSFGGTEMVGDYLNHPLLGDKNSGERSGQSSDLPEKKCDNVKLKKSRKPPKPPRPPKGPSLSANDQKLMREIADLAMRKRARIERMKTLRRMKAAKSPSSCSSIFAMIVTVLFFVFLVFQGFSRSNATMSSEDGSPSPTVSASDRWISVQFYNEFAPRGKIDPSPSSTTFRFMGEGVSGADNGEDGRDSH